MTGKVYVDASFFIATQIVNHPFHKNSLTILKKYSNYDLYFSLLTIDEIIYTLSKYKVAKDKVISVLREKIILIRNTKLLSYGEDIGHIEGYLTLWKDTGLKSRDALHLYFMKQANIKTIATFDEDFIKRGRELGIKILGNQI